MYNCKKYKTLIYLNIENTFKVGYNFLEKNPIYINYLQNKRLKIIREFIFLHSLFLLVLQFDSFIYKSELEFKIRQNSYYFFMLDDDYNNFFL